MFPAPSVSLTSWKPLSFVEPASTIVPLEHPKLEALVPKALHVVEQRCADATVLAWRICVEVGELVSR
jgi:hypothetical protein